MSGFFFILYVAMLTSVLLFIIIFFFVIQTCMGVYSLQCCTNNVHFDANMLLACACIYSFVVVKGALWCLLVSFKAIRNAQCTSLYFVCAQYNKYVYTYICAYSMYGMRVMCVGICMYIIVLNILDTDNGKVSLACCTYPLEFFPCASHRIPTYIYYWVRAL